MMFLKFSKYKERLEYLKKGNFYMKSGKFFIEQEKMYGNKGMGDSSELHNRQHELKLTIIPKGIDIKPFDLNAKILNMTSQGFYKKPIFCLTVLEDEDIIKDEKTGTFRFNLDNFEIEKMKKEFGNYVLILNGDYIDGLINKCKKENIGLAYGKIKYVNGEKNCKERSDAFFNKSSEFFFYKNKEFSHQKEFRFVVLDEEIEIDGSHEISVDIENEGEIMEVDDLFSGDYVFKFNNE